MATNTPNASIRLILARIVDVLNDYMDPGDVLNPTGGTRPIQLIRVGWPVPRAIASAQFPAIFAHADSCEDRDEYNGIQVARMTVTLSLIENILDTDMSMDHIYDYIDELRKLVFATHRTWEKTGQTDLSVISTLPIGWAASPVYEGEDHFLVQADLNMQVMRPLYFY
jgi:hypothetical protein